VLAVLRSHLKCAEHFLQPSAICNTTDSSATNQFEIDFINERGRLQRMFWTLG
jgi:hypothetical protein